MVRHIRPSSTFPVDATKFCVLCISGQHSRDRHKSRLAHMEAAKKEERYYLSKKDHEDRHEEHGDDESGTCSTSPPCGGCNGCIHAQVSYYFGLERDKADRAHAAGLEYANPSIINTQAMAQAGGGYSWGEYHDEWGHMRAGEK